MQWPVGTAHFHVFKPHILLTTYFRADTDSETAQGFASSCSQFSNLAAPPCPVCPRLCYHSSSFFFSFRAFETTQNTVTLVPEIHLSSQKLTPVCLGGERDVRAAPQMGSGWQGPPGTGAELCYLFSLHCRSGWCWGVVLGWELQGKEQLCPAHCPGQSGCCSLCCPSSSGPTATAWREGQERGWRGWIRSDILFPAEHLHGKREGNVTITEN